MTQEKIMVVEDELTIRETIVYNLEKQGYNVAAFDEGRAALNYARENQVDLIVMDIMLPGMDGMEVTRLLRRDQSTPILMLTARADEIDRVLGLEIGADDYMTKPFSMREFLARVKAMLRRVQMIRDDLGDGAIPKGEVLTFGNLTIDHVRHEVLVDGDVIAMKPKEYELLFFMAKNHRKVLTRELILERVWGWEFVGGTRTVDVHMRWLREKIEENPAEPNRIITVRGTGYRFDG